MSRLGKMIRLKSKRPDGAEIGAYHVAAQATQGPRKGGLVVIQEIFGVTDHIKDLCDGFARDGYEVVAPSVYDRVEPSFQTGYEPEDFGRARAAAQANPPDEAVGDVQAAIDLLKPRGKVFLAGYCYGGSLTYVAACRCAGLTAAAGFYGRLIPDYLDERPAVPTILHFGERDETIPMAAVRKVEAALPDVPVYVYDAGHGFCSDRPTHHDDAACALARKRTLEHFAKYA